MSTIFYWLIIFSILYILTDFLNDILSVDQSGLLMSPTIIVAIYKPFCTCFCYKNGFILHTLLHALLIQQCLVKIYSSQL